MGCMLIKTFSSFTSFIENTINVIILLYIINCSKLKKYLISQEERTILFVDGGSIYRKTKTSTKDE